MSGLKDVTAPEPEKYEDVEHWTFISTHGASVSYVVRVERGERGGILLNEIDRTPVAVQLKLHSDDEKNTPVAQLSFPVANLFHYSCVKGRQKVYAPGQSPAAKEAQRIIDAAGQNTLYRRGRMTRASVENTPAETEQPTASPSGE